MAATGVKTPSQGVLDQMWQHFLREFPADPAGALGKHFAKRSHAACNGRGVLTSVKVRATGDPERGELILCQCAAARRDRAVAELVRQGEAFDGPRRPRPTPVVVKPDFSATTVAPGVLEPVRSALAAPAGPGQDAG